MAEHCYQEKGSNEMSRILKAWIEFKSKGGSESRYTLDIL